MQITSRFTVAIHTMLCIAHYEGKKKMTSAALAGSTGADATIIRRLLGQLQTAGYVKVNAGVGGAHLIKPLKDITLLDLFRAVDAETRNLFRFYENPDCVCPVGNNIHSVLDGHLCEVQQAMYNKMQEINLQTLYEEIEPLLSKDGENLSS
ncbi:transcriptional regulator [Marvinbryantia formatexigens DSM 14469]|uniref:Transcriptional regulator n=1 Tax=Marvinbryantia formatexigens DSM 14469 TaxID=478749 RepID=C6LIE8_9FIRM|nr:Rrf2 family transcriptional regulator [Marvinbryantia formatexigens]EET59531.1 transcriptional regulator [Marvinbryantia formatexigens DSM 14469]UWO26350.1 Rrf2 family transcriptional regulator [Marvinbryantia formatexigens DSM 14469]SDG06646.1 DNA-binding transcriptional regulator, IscR family [Marvinbryantia formatexigens]